MCELHVINHLWIYLSNSGGPAGAITCGLRRQSRPRLRKRLSGDAGAFRAHACSCRANNRSRGPQPVRRRIQSVGGLRKATAHISIWTLRQEFPLRDFTDGSAPAPALPPRDAARGLAVDHLKGGNPFHHLAPPDLLSAHRAPRRARQARSPRGRQRRRSSRLRRNR